MGCNKYHPLPDRCCMKCKYGKLLVNSRIRCQHDSSYYFGELMAKKDHCPDFEPEHRKE